MVVKELDLGLDYKKAGIPVPEKLPTFTGFILQNYKEYCGDRKRPAVLVLPGGGYAFTSERPPLRWRLRRRGSPLLYCAIPVLRRRGSPPR